jgi:hypothetical protein
MRECVVQARHKQANLALNPMDKAERTKLIGRLKQRVADTGDKFQATDA